MEKTKPENHFDEVVKILATGIVRLRMKKRDAK